MNTSVHYGKETSEIHLRALPGSALAFASVLALMGTGTSVAQAPAYSILYSFQCGVDGSAPYGGLVRDSGDNLYGTTSAGGAFGLGTVYEIPAGGQEVVLHSFGAAPSDGEAPYDALVRDPAGNLYGTTEYGGASDFGTVFKISVDGTETVMHSFTGTDGSEPWAGLTLDAVGNLYGTTEGGGISGGGTVFEISPGGDETVLHNFSLNIATDGSFPFAGLVRDPAGNLYGTTEFGGALGSGTIFKVTAKGEESVLFSFSSGDGGNPVASLVRSPASGLYGTTKTGGDDGGGTVFRLYPTGGETVLFNFNPFGGSTGYNPAAGLIEDTKGNFYGTAEFVDVRGEYGLVFKLSATGQETVLHRFTGHPNDGNDPVAGLIQDPAGSLYGTTVVGGAGNCGTVFKIAP